MEPEPQLRYAFSIHVDFDPRPRLKFGPLFSGGYRGFIGVAGGSITGPRLQGTVLPYSGGDYPTIRNDGVVAFDARYLLVAADGTPIYLMNRGYRHAPPEVSRLMDALEPVDPASYYFRIVPTFDVPKDSPHEWLARTLFVGKGDRRNGYTDFEYYEVL
jgi:hypothetical protein